MGDLATCPRCGRMTFDLYLLRCISPSSTCGLEAEGAPPRPPAASPPPRPLPVEARPRATGRRWRFEIPLPPRAVSQNARVHWSKRARATREYRAEVAGILMSQGVPEEPVDFCEVSITGWVCYGTKGDGTSRSEDVPNLLGELKPALDALQPERVEAGSDHPGAGVIVSDHHRHLRSLSVTIREAARVEDEGVVIVVRELTRP